MTIHDREDCSCLSNHWCEPCLAEAVRLADEAAAFGLAAMVEAVPIPPRCARCLCIVVPEGGFWLCMNCGDGEIFSPAISLLSSMSLA